MLLFNIKCVILLRCLYYLFFLLFEKETKLHYTMESLTCNKLKILLCYFLWFQSFIYIWSLIYNYISNKAGIEILKVHFLNRILDLEVIFLMLVAFSHKFCYLVTFFIKLISHWNYKFTCPFTVFNSEHK